MNKEIIITDKVHDLLIKGLQEKGFNITYEPMLSYAEVCSRVKDYQGIIINSKVVCDAQFLDESRHLEFIGRLGSGLDIIDLDHAKSLNIEVISSPEGNAHSVGEHSLGMLLSLLNNIGRSHNSLKEFQWIREPNRGTELRSLTVGIIGFGHTGPAFAEKLKSFGVEILVFDKYRKDFNGHQVNQAALDTLLALSDVVSINLPLTIETANLVDAHFFKKMKKGSILINTSRGKIVNSMDLIESLENGHLGELA